MSLSNGMSNSNTSHTTEKNNSGTSSQKVARILDSEPVFQVALMTNQVRPRPVFFKPEKRMDSPFEDMFIPVNLGLKKYDTGNFIPANLGKSNEPNVYRYRPNNSPASGISYLIARTL